MIYKISQEKVNGKMGEIAKKNKKGRLF